MGEKILVRYDIDYFLQNKTGCGVDIVIVNNMSLSPTTKFWQSHNLTLTSVLDIIRIHRSMRDFLLALRGREIS